MDVEKLVKRAKTACIKMSLRQVGKMCSVSHEVIRKLVTVEKTTSMTLTTYNKIDAGLTRNGF